MRSLRRGALNIYKRIISRTIYYHGFFQILNSDGELIFSRDGTFKLSAEGQIVTSDGLLLQPNLNLPQDTEQVHISTDGNVSVKTTGSNDPEVIGQIELAKFVNPAGLSSLGRNLYAQTIASGEPQFGTPDSEGFGSILQGYLELSNVDVVEEMVNLIIAQRAYEINSKAIKTSEEMLSMANNLSR